ncbi:MAG: S8 family serine peptidase [Thermoplasmatota archaeon]
MSPTVPPRPGQVLVVKPGPSRTPLMAQRPWTPMPAKAAKPDKPGAPSWLRWTAILVASGVAIAAGFGVGILVRNGMPAGEPTAPFALYLTDAAMGLDRLDVEVGSVVVADGTPLQVVNSKFDLAGLHGPADALLVAKGQVPSGVDGPVRIHFTAVHARVGNVTYEIPDPSDLTLGGIQPDGFPASALLDVDLGASVIQTADGLRFAPQAAAVYAAEASQGQVPDWDTAAKLAPIVAGSQAPPPVVSPDTQVADALASPGAAAATGAADPSDKIQGDVNVDVLPAEAGVHEAGSAASTTQTGWLIHFGTAQNEDAMRADVEATGALYVSAFKSFPIAYVLANPLQVKALAERTDVVHLEREVPLRFNDVESKAAIRIPQLADALTGLRDHQGNPVDGRGIGVAVVDTGIDTLHPDLGNAVNPVVVANYKVETDHVVEVADTDTSGHGTHVAAIVAGAGVQAPDLRGAAPGAKLYGLGISEGATNVWATQAFDWILQNHDKVLPHIRVVTNSWGTGTTYDPDSAITQFVDAMVDEGLIVVFAAGNNGGDGSTIQTSAQCQIPKAGVICVAGYDDMGTGTRDGKVGSYSSRGAAAQPQTWPDISAPGSSVMSARPPAGVTTGAGLNLYYVELTGTSQAAPHVAAIAALMLQERPGLTPAMVELNMKLSAYKFADGGAYNLLGMNVAKGAGLADAYAAVQRVA